MALIQTAYRYHDFSYGHRVFGHESKCGAIHGHNGRVHFYCEAPELDSLGRVIDFGIIKSTLCDWVEETWDHKFLVSDKDPICRGLTVLDPIGTVIVPFNPTAENMAKYLLTVVGPEMFKGWEVKLVKVQLDETRKCSAIIEDRN
jgi:6-pyruvoyltetrahydropterin/6-carboxytetrahydropterin synthase